MTATLSKADLNALAESVREDVIDWRRHLHQNPELSFHEEKTAEYVYQTLLSFGNLEVSRPTKTSVMARLHGAKPGKVLAIRADMDALPIQEENTFEFASKNPGVMHACGHDGHTSVLLGAAKVLSRLQEHICGEIRFLFQHAEELFPGGAEEMVAAGVMNGVDLITGAHLWSTMPVGTVGVCYGPMMASPDTFYITVIGRGGHAAHPNQTVDSIAVGAQVVTNLQHIVSRNTDPLDNVVVSVCQFHAGTAHNIIPGTAEMVGTVRSFDPELRQHVPTLIERILKGVTEAHGATYEFKYEYGYRPVINDKEVTQVIEQTVVEVFGEETLDLMRPSMGGEDFSAFQTQAPGCYFFVGAGNADQGIIYPHHHPRFTVDEAAFDYGVKMFVHSAFKFLGQ